MVLEINNLTSHSISPKNFEALLNTAAAHCKVRQGSVSLAFVGEARIRTLNKFYRGKNKVTDVLSFGEPRKHTKTVPFDMPRGEEGFLGEVVICIREAQRKAKKYGRTLSEELDILFLHGFLHILGYDHETSERDAERMEAIEQEILAKHKSTRTHNTYHGTHIT